MSDIALKVENLTKEYRLGTIGHGTLREDLQSLFAKMRGKEDPNSLVTAKHNRESDEKHFLALDNLNFEIKKGDRVGIIGKNGAGKSTLLKVLSRITAPTKGNIYINGRIGSLLEVGTGFHPELSGRDNIYLSGSIMGMKQWEIDKKLDEIIDFSGVEKFIDTPVKRYSSGMFVRLGFAVAAHLEPDILIVDEVLAVGDAEFQKKAIGKMQDVSNDDGRTVLFVSHNMRSIESLCNKSIVLDSGQIDLYGETHNAIEYYFESNSLSSHDVKKLAIINFSDNHLIIKKVYLSTSSTSGKTLTTDESFEIKIHFIVKSSNIRIGFTLLLCDQEGNIVFSSIKNNDIYYNREIHNGEYISTCYIPGDLLNNGYYSVKIIKYYNNFSDTKKFDDVLFFRINDGIHVRKDYIGDWHGYIRPLLNWTTEKV